MRIDPATVHFQVHYAPQAPRPVSQWANDLQAPLVINGGYFTPEYETTGILISNGQTWGTPYGDFAGMFAVTQEGAATVRWLRLQPYDPAEPLAHALMSFPMLVQPGSVLGFPADEYPDPPAQRTVVAQDRQGRILFIVAPRGYLSLHDTARTLLESDLEIDSALNLDGGYSTGLWLTSEAAQVTIDSRVTVPSVLTVTPR